MRRGSSLVVTFYLVDSATKTPFKSGVVFSTGQSTISQDGGAFANTASLPAEIGSSGVYVLSLTALEMLGDWISLRFLPTGADGVFLPMATNGSPSGTVITGAGGNTATSFATSLTDPTNFWNDAILVFTSGTLKGQGGKYVTAFANTNGVITLSAALTATPTVGDRFALLNE